MSVYKRGGCDNEGPNGKCSKCGKKRGTCGVYWYKFMWNGELIRESTRQGNDNVARQMEAAHRTALAKGEVGIREKQSAPTLVEFCEKRFEPWAESVTTQKTWRDFYRVGLSAIKEYAPLASLRLDAITSERIAEFSSYRRAKGLQISSVNASLRILRRVLRIAVEWGELPAAPKIRLLAGENHRERVITAEEEARYLAAANPLLAEVASVLVDSGLRPEECYRLMWESITWVNGRHGTFLVTHGKTKAARRVLPMTPRVRGLLESRWEAAGNPLEGFVWPAPTKSGHMEPSALKKQHAKALKVSKVRPFVLYSLRHTFLTRLGESGCDAWTLARIAGHSSIAISSRYVHPSEDAVLSAMSRLGGHKIGHSDKFAVQAEHCERLLSAAASNE
jgi:integrase